MNMEDVRERVRELIKEQLGIEPRVKVFGFGGGAGRVIEYIHARNMENVKTIAVNVDKKIDELNVHTRMLVGKDILGEHNDTNGEVKVAEYIIQSSKAWIIEEAMDSDVVVLIGALGGGMGTGGMIETLRILKDKVDRPVVPIVIMPLSIEKDRREKAQEVLNEMRKMERCIVIDSDAILSAPSVKVSRAYNMMYERISDLIEKIANIAKKEIEKKFEELYLGNLDSIIEKEYQEAMSNMQVAA